VAEWLEADGLGGFAMGTADGIRTRRYHALLLAALAPPDQRKVLVADLEVHVETEAGTFALSSHRYRGDVIHPDGELWLARFDAAPWPRWEHALPDGTRIATEVVVEPGTPRVVVRWTLVAGRAAKLAVRPLLAARDYHALEHEGPWRFDAEVDGDRVAWRPRDGFAIHARGAARYVHAPDWYRHFIYALECERGLDHEEDLASPGVFHAELAAPAVLAFATAPVAADFAGAFERERVRRAAAGDELDHAADAYLVARGTGRTVIAGYPWFCDWGRDTFISLRGLCLVRGRRDVARAILLEWAPRVSEGMLPNRFGEDDATPEYNSVDAALWFVIAADAYLRSGPVAQGDQRTLVAAIDAIVTGTTRGTRHGIAATPDGLLACGAPGLQLTWMDAKIGDEVVTPRIGKPVEIQALWLNALAIAGREDAFARGRAAFVERFWDPERGQLHDVVDADHVAGAVDASCRPNQVFAVGGLPRPIVDGEIARAVVATVERELWTPVGPRSLAPAEPRYRGRYVGGPIERDRAYHNGPVWPWLAGAFVEAWLRVHGDTAAAREEARARFVAPLRARAANGHLAEIYEGDPPHRAAGCPFQAWSVAELVRLERALVHAG
jgi:predicted glycogen debranching enzyme